MRKMIALFLVALMCVGWPSVSGAADRVGDWNGYQKEGTVTGSSAYVNWYGEGHKIAVLFPFDDETFTWVNNVDSADAYSGVYSVADWLSDKGTVTYAMNSDSSRKDLWLQTSYDKSTWFNAVQLGDSIGSTATVDTIDLTDPVCSTPFIRFKLATTGQQFVVVKLDYMYVKFVKPE
jgi:hypothetical protein